MCLCLLFCCYTITTHFCYATEFGAMMIWSRYLLLDHWAFTNIDYYPVVQALYHTISPFASIHRKPPPSPPPPPPPHPPSPLTNPFKPANPIPVPAPSLLPAPSLSHLSSSPSPSL